MSELNRKTPGVYIIEMPAFPPAIVGVQTAVPAFIGYTQKAEVNGKSALNQSIQITSMADFESFFGGRYTGSFSLALVTDPALIGQGDYDVNVPSESTPTYVDVDAPALRFNLYASMKLFFANGGGTCFVVSVGSYAAAPDKDALLAGLQAMSAQSGPTMLVVPDAVLLPPTDVGEPTVSAGFQAVVQAMQQQAQTLQDRIAVLDVYGTTLIGTKTSGGKAIALDDVITQFHTDVSGGDPGLSYGAAYFPFLASTVYQAGDFDFTSVSPIDDSTAPVDLKRILTSANNATNPRGANHDTMQKAIDSMATVAASGDATAIRQLTQQLSVLAVMQQILAIVTTKSNVLPPSGCMAGVMAFSDQNRGVWNAPANIVPTAVADVTLKLNDQQQGNLNVPLDGKAINVIRYFVGRGPTVWGARTLDGNSNDWRYIQVRRTIIYIEQSIKNALNQFVFAANDGQTWVTVTAMISNFLTSLWSQGGLMGDKASDAFTVQCGLGSTMTGQDILDGRLIAQIGMAMTRPAEFIILVFTQQIQGS